MKISKTDCLRTPKADGFYMPGEFEPHEGTLMIWPWRPGSWTVSYTHLTLPTICSV